MSDTDEEEETEPAVTLGDGPSVEGAPLARVLSRLHYPIEKSDVDRREGETSVRTPDGPRELGDVLAETDEVYFPTDNDLRAAVEDVVGTGPVPTDGDASSADDETAGASDAAGDEDAVGDETAADSDAGDADEEGEFEFDAE